MWPPVRPFSLCASRLVKLSVARCQTQHTFQTPAQAWEVSRDLACVLFSTSHLSLPSPLLPPVNSPAHTTLVPILMFPTFVENRNDFLVSYSNKTPETSFPCTVRYQHLAVMSVLINGWRKIYLPAGKEKKWPNNHSFVIWYLFSKHLLSTCCLLVRC